MQKLNYGILALLLILVGINIYSFFSNKDTNIESLKSQNESLREEFKNVKQSVDQIDANLKNQLSKVDSSIAVSKKSIDKIESGIIGVRSNLNTLRKTDPESYYQSLTTSEKEKIKKLIYQDVSWEQ